MSLDCSFLVAPRFSLPFICLSSSCVLCADGCPCLWIVHSCLPPRFSLTFICLSSSCVLCADGCQCLWIVHSWLPPRFSLTFICLSSSCVLCVEGCQCLWIVHSCLLLGFLYVYLFVFVLCLVCRGLPMSLDCPFLVAPRFSLTFICLSSSCVLCADGCQCLWIAHSSLLLGFL